MTLAFEERTELGQSPDRSVLCVLSHGQLHIQQGNGTQNQHQEKRHQKGTWKIKKQKINKYFYCMYQGIRVINM